ncbi:MAG: FAD-dependent thymidylate synthase [Phycisphaerae bacterium]
MKIISEPQIYLIGRQEVAPDQLESFLADHNFTWQTDTQAAPEQICEIAGRLCYTSYGKGRKSNQEYIRHILEVGHGSVLEHAVWSFLITGVSRSFTHELVRHRVGFSYSQLSQRYVDETETDFVEPADIANDPDMHKLWLDAVESSRQTYIKLVDKLSEKYTAVQDKTLRRKLARQAARSVLPNATETKIFVTANARSLRNFIELRANEAAEVEIRKVAVKILQLMQKEAPNIFGDYEIYPLADGTQAVRTPYRKV